MKYIPINWNPYRNNPLDHIFGRSNKQLITPDGSPVSITQDGLDFVVTIWHKRTVTGSNINTCYFLNTNEVGYDATNSH